MEESGLGRCGEVEGRIWWRRRRCKIGGRVEGENNGKKMKRDDNSGRVYRKRTKGKGR